MVIGIILGILLLAGVVGCIVLSCKTEGSTRVICAAVAIACLLAFIIVPFSIHTVDTGEIAVVKRMGKIVGQKEAGTSFDLWLTKSYQYYDIKVRSVDIQTAAYSSDAQTMDVAMTFQYSLKADKIIEIATEYGSISALENRIQSVVVEKTKAVLSSHKAMDIIATRAAISPEVEKAVREAIGDEYYINITTVVLTNIDFSDAFELAVEEKMVAEQTKLKADYENQTKVAKAEADAEAELKAAQAGIEIAEAEAEALKIAAQAQADANKLIADSLTDEVLKDKFYDKWNGELPKVMGNEATITEVAIDESSASE